MFVQEIVNEYKKNTEEYPINNSVSIDLSNVKDSSKFQFDKETKKGQTITLYEIDFSLLEKTDLINGNKKNNDQTDIYAVSEKTGIVYYLKGVKVSNLTYYTLTDDLKEIIGYDMSETSQNNAQENDDTDLPVIEVLSTQAMVNEKSNEKSTKEGGKGNEKKKSTRTRRKNATV